MILLPVITSFEGIENRFGRFPGFEKNKKWECKLPSARLRDNCRFIYLRLDVSDSMEIHSRCHIPLAIAQIREKLLAIEAGHRRMAGEVLSMKKCLKGRVVL
jgi:hypothetical protein